MVLIKDFLNETTSIKKRTGLYLAKGVRYQNRYIFLKDEIGPTTTSNLTHEVASSIKHYSDTRFSSLQYDRVTCMIK